jgi:hypothetical protein
VQELSRFAKEEVCIAENNTKFILEEIW